MSLQHNPFNLRKFQYIYIVLSWILIHNLNNFLFYKFCTRISALKFHIHFQFILWNCAILCSFMHFSGIQWQYNENTAQLYKLSFFFIKFNLSTIHFLVNLKLYLPLMIFLFNFFFVYNSNNEWPTFKYIKNNYAN